MTAVMFWNLFESGRRLLSGDDRLWREQVRAVRRWRPDVLAVTEGWQWDLGDAALFHRAMAEYEMTDGWLYRAKTGCHMAIMWAGDHEVGGSELAVQIELLFDQLEA